MSLGLKTILAKSKMESFDNLKGVCLRTSSRVLTGKDVLSPNTPCCNTSNYCSKSEERALNCLSIVQKQHAEGPLCIANARIAMSNLHVVAPRDR